MASGGEKQRQATAVSSTLVMFVQVMHGADNDVLWLQRDYRAYLVNILDTEKCCQVEPTSCVAFQTNQKGTQKGLSSCQN